MLKVCAIVKNSGKIIKKVLKSYIGYADSFLILDTGSTDNTQDYIRKTLKNCKYELYEEPFEGFVNSRNRCLDLCDQSSYKSKYYIMIDDSQVLYGGKELIQQLSIIDDPVIFIQIRLNNISFYSTRITKANSKVRYKGVGNTQVHESIDYPEARALRYSYLCDERDEKHTERSLNRYKDDINEMKKNENHKDCCFHIGNTYLALYRYTKNEEDRNNFLRYFTKRVLMNDNDEQVFYCMINIGHDCFLNKKNDKAAEWYMKASKITYNRKAEALFYLWCCTGIAEQLKEAYENIKNVYEIPPKLTIDYDVYENVIPYAYSVNFKL